MKMKIQRKEKVKKGCLAVWVGGEREEYDMQRFTIPISYLYHPHFRMLLDKAREVYGFRLPGALKLPCSVDHFLRLQWLVGSEITDKNYRFHHKQHLPDSLSSKSR